MTLVGVTFGLPGKVNPNPVYNIYCAGTIEVTGCTFVPGSSRNGPFQDAVKVRFSSPGKSAWINAAGTMLFGPGGGDVNFLRFAAGIVGTSQKLVATGGIGVGSAASRDDARRDDFQIRSVQRRRGLAGVRADRRHRISSWNRRNRLRYARADIC